MQNVVYLFAILLILPFNAWAQNLSTTIEKSSLTSKDHKQTKKSLSLSFNGTISSREGNLIRLLNNQLTFDISQAFVNTYINDEPTTIDQLVPGRFVNLGISASDSSQPLKAGVVRVLVDNEAQFAAPLQAVDLTNQTLTLFNQKINVNVPIFDLDSDDGQPLSLDKLVIGNGIFINAKLEGDQLVAKSAIYMEQPNSIQLVTAAVHQIADNRLMILNNRIICDLSNATILDAQYNRTIPFSDIASSNGFRGNVSSVENNILKLHDIQVSVPKSCGVFGARLNQVDPQARLIQILNLPVIITPEAVIIKANGRKGNFSALQIKRQVVVSLTSSGDGIKSNLIQVIKLNNQDHRLNEIIQKGEID